MFLCEFCKIVKNIFWQDTSGWLLLVFICQFWEVVQMTSFLEYFWETYFKYKLLDSAAYRVFWYRLNGMGAQKMFFHVCFT